MEENMTKIQKLSKRLNEKFRDELATEMKTQFGVEIETLWDIVSDTIVSTRTDGKPFTRAQYDFMKAFEAGFTRAMAIVRSSE
jgi:hypothetical protein